MTAAVVQMQIIHGSDGSPSYASAEGGLVMNRSDDESPAKTLPVPDTAPGSNYANYKAIQFVVVTPGDTMITNLAIRKASAETDGLRLFYGAPGAYEQCTGDGPTQGNRPADSTSALASSPAPNTPGGYTPLTTSFHVFDTGSYDSSSTGPFGDVLPFLLGVSSAYGAGGNDATGLPPLYWRYSES